MEAFSFYKGISRWDFNGDQGAIVNVIVNGSGALII